MRLVPKPGSERGAIEAGWRAYYEHPVTTLATADAVAASGVERGQPALVARAHSLAAAVEMHRGRLDAAAVRVDAAEAAGATDPRSRADVAGVAAQLAFFIGDYERAVARAREAIAASDESGDLAVQIRVRRATCVVYGNLKMPELTGLVAELLDLAVATDEPYEQAISRNDLANLLFERGQAAAALVEADRALALLGRDGGGNRLAVAVIRSTRSDARRAVGDLTGALEDADHAVGLLLGMSEPNPYVLAATVRSQLATLLALGRPDDARAAGQDALRRIGSAIPYMRSRLMFELAAALRDSGLETDAAATEADAAALQGSEPEPAPLPQAD